MAYKIAIFAGHDDDTFEKTGGKGLNAPEGKYEEYDTNFAIAKNLVVQLSKYAEIDVLFPQENGRDMSLKERVDYCNKHNVDLAIFEHSNAAGRAAHGACAFYWHSSKEGKRLADYYAEEMEKAGYDLWSNGTYPCIPDTWSEFYVIKHTKMVALLPENLFFTNDKERAILRDPDHQEKIAVAHEKMTVRYLDIDYKPDEEVKAAPERNTASLQIDKGAEVVSSSDRGKRVESIYSGNEGLNFYAKPTWDNPVGVFYEGQGWTIIEKIKVDGAYQYKVKNSKGAIYYVTASPRYVNVINDKPAYIGKRVEAIVPQVNFYDSPRWNNPSGQFYKGQGWTIVGKLTTNGSPQYQVKNSKGDIYYITARKDLVKVIY